MTEAAKDTAKEMMLPIGIVGIIVTTAIGWGKTEAHVSVAQAEVVVLKNEIRSLEKEFNKIDKKLNIIGYRIGVKNMDQIGEALEE